MPPAAKSARFAFAASVLLIAAAAVSLVRAQQRAPAPPPPAQQEELPSGYAIQRDVNLVVLHASVVNSRGQFFPGLKQENFRVFEDKIEQKLSVFRQEDVAVSLGLVHQQGTGRSAHPFRYWLPEREAVWRQDPLWAALEGLQQQYGGRHLEEDEESEALDE